MAAHYQKLDPRALVTALENLIIRQAPPPKIARRVAQLTHELILLLEQFWYAHQKYQEKPDPEFFKFGRVLSNFQESKLETFEAALVSMDYSPVITEHLRRHLENACEMYDMEVFNKNFL